MHRRALFANLILSMLIFGVLLTTSTYAESATSEIIVMFDFAHDPVIGNYSLAMNYIKQEIPNIKIINETSSLTHAKLSSVDLLVILHPRFNFMQDEIEAINLYLQRGGIAIILGMDYMINRTFNPAPENDSVNSLLEGLDLEKTIRLGIEKENLLSIIDPLSDIGYLNVTSEYFTDKLKDNYLNDTYNLILESNAVTVVGDSPLNYSSILAPPQACILLSNNTMSYPSPETYLSIGLITNVGNGTLAILGFGLSLSDIVEKTFGKPWINLGDNARFWIDLVRTLLKHKIPLGAQVADNRILIIIVAITGILGIVVGALAIIKKPKKERVKKKELKLSDVLKKLRSSK